MSTLEENLSQTVEAFGGKKAKLLVDLGLFIVDEIKSRHLIRKKKMELLMTYEMDPTPQYNETILKNYISRRYRLYKSRKTATISNIRHEIEYQKFARNVIITGQAAVGKTTALKWLFINSNIPGFAYIYLTARMFANADSIEEISVAIEEAISEKENCIIFFDGLDELKCVKGDKNELESFVEMFNQKTRRSIYNSNRKFVISTRAEHFSFEELVRKNNLKKSLDNYIVYEVLPLNKQESLDLCKSIKRLYLFDVKYEFSHFRNKWPNNENKQSALSEKEYLKRLKLYINLTNEQSSLLTSPLLCRYAYQIICEWKPNHISKEIQEYTSASERIENVISSFIKWEFHDQHMEQTESNVGKKKFEAYKGNLFRYLQQIAAEMGIDNYIEKEKWRKYKSTKSIESNAAFCVLSEDESGNLQFLHESFREFFLAGYYVEIMSKHPDEKIIDVVVDLLEHKVSFVNMYIDQLLRKGNKISKNVCKNILMNENISTNIRHNATEVLTNYALGNFQLIFDKGKPFTIEEYFTVFPKGKALYAGRIFDYRSVREIIRTGLLKIEDPDVLGDFNVRIISNSISLSAITLRPKYSLEFKNITLSFKCSIQKQLITIAGFWTDSFNQADIERIIRILDLNHYSSIDEIINDGSLSKIIMAKKIEDWKTLKKEHDELDRWIKNIATQLGCDDSYWCLYDGQYLHAYKIAEKNEKKLVDNFLKGRGFNLIDYTILYREYIAKTVCENNLIELAGFTAIEDVDISFDGKNNNVEIKETCFSTYYSIHWKNLKLIKLKQKPYLNEYNEDDFNENAKRVLLIHELYELFAKMDSLIKTIENEKIQLIISDEKIITYYLLGEGDKMVETAEGTIDLCRRFNHSIGEELRRYLVSDDACYGEKGFKKVIGFSKDYIWA